MNNKIVLSLLIAILSIINVINPCFSYNNGYLNQLLNLNINKTSENSIDVDLITSKPYTMKYNIIKKSDNKFVIFLPETNHSITSSPDLTFVGDLVKNIDVKLIPVIGSSSNNGYTKITIQTKNNVALKVKTSVYKEKKEIEDELSKLLLDNKDNLKTEEEAIKKAEEIITLTPVKKASKPKQIKKIYKKKTKKIVHKKRVVKKEQHAVLVKPVKSSESSLKVNLDNNQIPINIIIDEKLENKDSNEVIDVTDFLDQADKKDIISVNPPIQEKKTNTFMSILVLLLKAGLIFFGLAAVYVFIVNKKNSNKKDEAPINRLNNLSSAINIEDEAEKDELNFDIDFDNEDESEPITDMPKETHVPGDVSYLYETDLLDETEEISDLNTSQSSVATIEPPQEVPSLTEDINVLDGTDVADGIGIYVVASNEEKTLIGIIDSNVFMLEKFGDVPITQSDFKQIDIIDNVAYYLVNINKWKAAVSVSVNNIEIVEVYS